LGFFYLWPNKWPKSSWTWNRLENLLTLKLKCTLIIITVLNTSNNAQYSSTRKNSVHRVPDAFFPVLSGRLRLWFC
jgi:hypothetical protein